MLDRRQLLAGLPAAAGARSSPTMFLCLHHTTTIAAGYRRTLEASAKAGIRYVEVIPAHVDEFVRTNGMPAARRLLSDLGLKAVSSGGVRGLWEPNPGRAKALEELKARAAVLAELGIDRMVCPCPATEKYTLDDYKRAVDHMREAGEIAKPYRVTAMVEFMRGSTFLGTLATALKLVREAGHPNVRPMFDFYHFHAGLSRFEELELIQSGELHHVHFQDVPNLYRELLDNSTREIPGDGVAPIVKTLQALKRRGYRGPLSVELFYPKYQKGDPAEVAAEIRRKCDPLMRKAGVA